MENCNALIVDAGLTEASGYAEREAAKQMLARQPRRPPARRRALEADKGYDVAAFVEVVRKLGFTPHAPSTPPTRNAPSIAARPDMTAKASASRSANASKSPLAG